MKKILFRREAVEVALVAESQRPRILRVHRVLRQRPTVYRENAIPHHRLLTDKPDDLSNIKITLHQIVVAEQTKTNK